MTSAIQFGGFFLDLRGEQLRCGAANIALRPKAFLVLRRLVENAGTLVTIDQLLDHAWPGLAVTPSTLTNVIVELRLALADDRAAPRFIETVHRRGYRFIANVNADHQEAAAAIHVGRRAELAALTRAWQQAGRGERQVVLIRGEPGIGKTSLIDAFLATLGTPPDRNAANFLWARSHCIEQEAGREPYMPILEALEQLCRGAQGERLIALLRQYAPTWLVQFPWLLSGEERAALQSRMPGTGPARMLREGAALLDALTQDTPLLLVIEDLHWADSGTTDWLATIALRTGHARLLVIGTFRPIDAVVHSHRIATVARRLRQEGRCVDLPLAPFSAAEVQTYLEERLSDSSLPLPLGAQIIHHSGGNPLFVSTLVSHLVDKGWLVKHEHGWEMVYDLDHRAVGLPEDLRALIDSQLRGLSPRLLEILEAGSVEGPEFSAGIVASAIACRVEEVEEACHDAIAPGNLIREASPHSSRYGFVHALYERAVYERIAPARRRRLHQRIGEALEHSSGAGVHDIAVPLAVHFEAAEDIPRSERYRTLAARLAGERFSYRDAAGHLERALTYLAQQPEGHERDRREATLQIALANSRLGYGAGPAILDAMWEGYERAELTARRAAAHHERFRALMGLGSVHRIRGDVQSLRASAEQLVEMTTSVVPELTAQAYWRLGDAHLSAGQFPQARAALERAAQADPYPQIPVLHDVHSAVWSLLAAVHSYLGNFKDATTQRARALDRAEAVGLPFGRCLTAMFLLESDVVRCDAKAALTMAEEVVLVTEQHAIEGFRQAALLHREWARSRTDANLERAETMRAYLARHGANTEAWSTPRLCAEIADAYWRAGDASVALDHVSLGISSAERNFEKRDLADLWRLRGEIRWQQGDTKAATDHIDHAISLAREQGCLLYELRATIVLCRLLAPHKKTSQARTRLREIHDRFDADDESFDLQEARALLAQLKPR